jgi:anti-sigma factor RsiW
MSKPDVPGYVEAALQAHAVSQVRAVMASQLEAPEYDRDELLSATAIVMPTLPADWVVTDVQVYPSRFGPSVEMALDAGALGRASIFAARPGDDDRIEPTMAGHGGATLSHWQMGEIAYVLVGRAKPSDILAAAQELAHSLD